jgi:hypothetical protein
MATLEHVTSLIGRYIETHRTVRPGEQDRYGLPAGSDWGGAGWLIGVSVDPGGAMLIEVDWGMAWTVDEHTTILEVPAPDDAPAPEPR